MDQKWFWRLLVSPKGKYTYISHDSDSIFFDSEDPDEKEFSLYNGHIPILLESAIFDSETVKKKIPTTQNAKYSDTKVFKNYVRKKIMPSLTRDNKVESRYTHLLEGKDKDTVRVLVIGAGQKSQYYKNIFGHNTITSDVHLQYGVDLIFDAHYFPFADETFDIVLAQQVLEHCIRPWVVAHEIQRVLKVGGQAQIEVPFTFPYHSAPYDFYRYTYSGIRSLFMKSKVLHLSVPEGNFSAIAIVFSNALIETTSNRYVRIFFLIFSRCLFWPLKYFDFLVGKKLKNHMSLPKGYAITFEKDGVNRSDDELIKEIENEINKKMA